MTSIELMEAANKARKNSGISRMEFGELKQLVKENKAMAKNAVLRIEQLEKELETISNSLTKLIPRVEEIETVKGAKKPKPKAKTKVEGAEK